MTFLGTHPTLTQVPPNFLKFDSINNTLAPYLAALLAEATPPDPPPMTK